MSANQYTYSISTDFSNGVYAPQLDAEIKASSIEKTLVGVMIKEDDLTITFNQSLTTEEKTTLDGLISSHVAQPNQTVRPRLTIKNGILTAAHQDINLKYYGNRTGVVKVDKEGQGDFTTLKAAVAAHPVPGMTYIVYPGLYIEDNPIQLPPQTIVKAASGDSSNTVFACYKPWLPIIKLGSVSALHNLTITNAFMQGGIGVEFDGSGPPGIFSRIQGCLIIDCWTGCLLKGPPNSVYFFESAVLAVYKPISAGIVISDGVFAGAISLLVSGNAYNKIPTGLCSIGLESTFIFGSGIVTHCVNCLHIADNGDINCSFVSIEKSERGCYIDNDGKPDTILKLDNCTFYDHSKYHIELTGSVGEFYFSNCKVQENLIHNPKNAVISSTVFSSEDGKYYQSIMGDIRVGSARHPSSITVGQGSTSTVGNAVLVNDNLEVGVWVNETQTASSNDHECFDLILDGKKNNCVYVGNDIKFYGFKVNVHSDSLTKAESGQFQWEFWNGTAWEPLKIMAVSSKAPYFCRGNKIATLVEKQYVYFNLTIDSPMEQKELYNITKYWVRGRITSDITTIPKIDKVKTFHSYHSINKDGYVQNFGAGSGVETLSWKMSNCPEIPPDDEDIYYSKTLCIKGSKNLYPPGETRRKAMVDNIPASINIAFPVVVNWRFAPRGETSGNVRWRINYGKFRMNDYCYNNYTEAPVVHHTEKYSIVDVNLTAADKNKILDIGTSLDLNDFTARPEDGNHDMLWLTLERMGGSTEDTYNAPISFIRICEVKYIEWCHGNHIQSLNK